MATEEMPTLAYVPKAKHWVVASNRNVELLQSSLKF